MNKIISRVITRKIIDAIVKGALKVLIQALTLSVIDLILRVFNLTLYSLNLVLYLNLISSFFS